MLCGDASTMETHDQQRVKSNSAETGGTVSAPPASAGRETSDGSYAPIAGHETARFGYAPPSPGALAAHPRERVDGDTPAGLWRRDLQWIVAALVVCVLAWLTYSRGGWVPLLSDADLAVHEFGHLLTRWAPALVCSFFGSFFQVAVPLGLAGYFWWRKDRFAVIVCGAWAAESLNNVAVYIADAQRMVLALFGDDGSGAGHDWHNILGNAGLLNSTDAIATAVRVTSVCLFVASFGLAAYGLARAHRR
jgi:hypothetical protein